MCLSHPWQTCVRMMTCDQELQGNVNNNWVKRRRWWDCQTRVQMREAFFLQSSCQVESWQTKIRHGDKWLILSGNCNTFSARKSREPLIHISWRRLLFKVRVTEPFLSIMQCLHDCLCLSKYSLETFSGNSVSLPQRRISFHCFYCRSFFLSCSSCLDVFLSVNFLFFPFTSRERDCYSFCFADVVIFGSFITLVFLSFST